MRSEEEMVAYALEVNPSLLPHMPELLADLEELGSDAELIVRILRQLDLPSDANVLDLGCGKGATAVEIADELGLRVLGVDLFVPFVDACRALAKSTRVSHLCTFRHGNILNLVGALPPADVVVFSALGDVLGPLDETIGIVRRFVEPGGVMVISDGYLRAGVTDTFPGFEGYVERDETLRRLLSHGDRLEREVLEPAPADGAHGLDDSDRESDDDTRRIRARAERIARKHPALREDLLRYVADQAAENVFLAESFIGTVWVLRRSDAESQTLGPRCFPPFRQVRWRGTRQTKSRSQRPRTLPHGLSSRQ